MFLSILVAILAFCAVCAVVHLLIRVFPKSNHPEDSIVQIRFCYQEHGNETFEFQLLVLREGYSSKKVVDAVGERLAKMKVQYGQVDLVSFSIIHPAK